MFSVAPAQAATPAALASSASTGVLDPVLSSITPQISGVGTIAGTYATEAYSCTSGITGVFTCPALPGLLSSLTGGSLTAAPGAGYQFDTWSGCTSVSSDGATCYLAPLSQLVANPMATFVKAVDGGTGGGTGGGTTDTLKTLLLDKPAATTGPDVSFLLGTDPADAAATYTCTLTGPGQTGTPTPCGSSVSYTDLANGNYMFTALAKTATLTGLPASFPFSVSDTPLAPDTTVTGGPRNNGWLLATATKFRLSSSSQLPVTYDCTLDGKVLEGCTDPVELTRLAQRTHLFKAAAGNGLSTDATPATRVFTVPVNNTKLKASTGWAKRKAKGHFLNTFSQTKRHGATLKVRRSAIRSVALVVAKGRGYGTVNVYLGKKLLKKVSLRANRRAGKRVVPIKKFSSKKHGTITVKVVSRGKLVRIEGLGISSR